MTGKLVRNVGHSVIDKLNNKNTKSPTNTTPIILIKNISNGHTSFMGDTLDTYYFTHRQH